MEATPRENRDDEVLRRLDALERRVAALEHHEGLVPPARPAVPGGEEAESARRRVESAEWIPLVGRTLLVLGGAFVLRAVTESGWMSDPVGIGLGIAYAMMWLLLADSAGTGGRRWSATWHGVAATIIAYPLLWEATVKFGLLAPLAAAGATAIVSAAAWLVVWRQRLRVLAWVVTLSSVTILGALAVSTRMLAPFTAVLLLSGLATLWLGYARGIRGPAWLAASAAFAAILLLTLLALRSDPERLAEILDPRTAFALPLSLLVVYVGSGIVRTLVRRRTLRTEEIGLGTTATVVGLGGAAVVASTTGIGLVWLGALSVALGMAGYWAAFVLVDLEQHRTNFVYFSSLALVFVLVAASVLLPRPGLAVALSLLAVVLAWIGKLRGRTTLSLHGAVSAIMAAIVSGMVARSLETFVASAAETPSAVTTETVIALAAATLYCAIPSATRERTWGRLAPLPKFVVLTAAALGLAGTITALGVPWLPRDVGGEGPAPQALAVFRTGVLSVAAVGLAWIGRGRLLRVAAWLVYPALVVCGVKILIEDLRVGDPASLVASFVLYGSALILAPRLTHFKARDS